MNDKLWKEIVHQSDGNLIKFKIFVPNLICTYRWRTFSEKEPETLDWIDEYGGEGTLFDVGANIGIYSIYYAQRHDGEVYSFEPSVFNLKQLAKNISINNLEDKIHIVPNPLPINTEFAIFKNENADEGGALSEFGVGYGFDGEKIDFDYKYQVLGFSLDDLIAHGLIKDSPALIKIDVDGIEHLILRGARTTLMHKN